MLWGFFQPHSNNSNKNSSSNNDDDNNAASDTVAVAAESILPSSRALDRLLGVCAWEPPHRHNSQVRGLFACWKHSDTCMYVCMYVHGLHVGM